MKKFKKILALALCLLMVLGAAVACDSSDETDESTTEAATTAAKETETEAETEPEEDKKDDDKENEGDEPASDAIGISSLAEMTEKRGNYYLTANIGTADAPNETHLETFAGTLDGKGFTVFTKVPLFDDLSDGATIKNLTIDGAVSVTGTMAGVITPNAKGTITLEKVINKATLTVEQTEKSYVGALVGFAGVGGTFTDCENNATITVNPSSEKSFALYMGGLVGAYEGGTDTKFTGCKNTGRVVSTATSGTSLMGGLVGNAKGAALNEFTNCSNSAVITNPSNAGGGKTGGIVSLADNAAGTYKFINCKNTASISAYCMVAGIAADVRGITEMTGCVNTGDLTAETPADTTPDINKAAGGMFSQIINVAGSTISKCANYGKISAGINKSGKTSNAAGIGALIGIKVTFVDCINYGVIEANKEAGGIIGRVNVVEAALTRCINIGDVTGTNAGSLIGHVNKGEADKFIVLTDCYAIDTITYGIASSNKNGNLKYVYGGEVKGTVIGTDISEDTVASAYSALFTTHGAKSADALKGDTAKTTLAGFDFTNTWKAVANGYPELA